MGLLFLLVSCSSEVTKSETESFLAGLSTMMGQAMMDESTQIINDFQAKQPPDPGITSYIEILGDVSVEKLRNPDPFGLDTLYGTWRYDAGTYEWYLHAPGDPANAIIFEWAYLDTASVAHTAEIRIDSLDFYQDSLPAKAWAGVSSDNNLLAWLRLEAEYSSDTTITDAQLVYEIVDVMQVGVSLSSTTNINQGPEGTINLWIIDRTTDDYRIDLVISGGEDGPENLVLSDSDGWEMDVNFDVVVVGEYERVDVSGEITKDGNHAADIEGVIWEPEDETHMTEITVIFSDGTENSLFSYLPEESFESGLEY